MLYSERTPTLEQVLSKQSMYIKEYFFFLIGFSLYYTYRYLSYHNDEQSINDYSKGHGKILLL